MFRHCEGKDSIEKIRSTYQAKLVKLALTKLNEGKDHDCDSFMSDAFVLYKSCVSHLAKWTTLFAEFKCFG